MRLTMYPTKRGLTPGGLVSVGSLTILTCVCANIIIRTLAVAVFGVSAAFQPLQPAALIVSTVVYLLLAIATFALVSRISKRPTWTFRILASACLLVSLLFPLMALTGGFPTPGMTVGIFWAMVLMHICSAAIVIALLPTAIRRK